MTFVLLCTGIADRGTTADFYGKTSMDSTIRVTLSHGVVASFAEFRGIQCHIIDVHSRDAAAQCAAVRSLSSSGLIELTHRSQSAGPPQRPSSLGESLLGAGKLSAAGAVRSPTAAAAAAAASSAALAAAAAAVAAALATTALAAAALPRSQQQLHRRGWGLPAVSPVWRLRLAPENGFWVIRVLKKNG